MPRPKKRPEERESHVYTLRLKPVVAARIEAIREHYQSLTPVGEITPTDVIRHLVEEGSIDAAQAISGPLLNVKRKPVSRKKSTQKTRQRKGRDG